MRTRNLPPKVSEQELKELDARAKAEGFPTLAAWIRERLGLAQVRPGKPLGFRHEKKGGE